MFSDPGKKGKPFWGRPILSGAVTKKKREKGARLNNRVDRAFPKERSEIAGIMRSRALSEVPRLGGPHKVPREVPREKRLGLWVGFPAQIPGPRNPKPNGYMWVLPTWVVWNRRLPFAIWDTRSRLGRQPYPAQLPATIKTIGLNIATVVYLSPNWALAMPFSSGG